MLTNIVPTIPHMKGLSHAPFLLITIIHHHTIVTGNKYTTAGRRNIRNKSQKKGKKPKTVFFEVYSLTIEYNKNIAPETANDSVTIQQL